jgi:hypothetical protein
MKLGKMRGTWINGVLLLLGAPRTEANRKFLWGWWQCEGGNYGPKGNVYPSPKFNWLSTTQSMFGATNYNEIGVKNYLTWIQGVRATVKTLKNGRYDDILIALKNGNPFLKQPLNGLSIWLTGKPVNNNPVGLAYAKKVIKTGWEWKL